MSRRSAVNSEIRSFFSKHGFIEADTPALTPSVIPEAPIELFKTSFRTPYSAGRDMYLLPSPEYYLKQLIAGGSGDIFSLSKSYRNSEQTGEHHNPEFTMLEYYKMDADCTDSIDLTEDMIDNLLCSLDSSVLSVDAPGKLAPPFNRISMDRLFDQILSFDLSRHCSGELSAEEERAELAALAADSGLSASESDSWEMLFNLVFVHEIEPRIASGKPTVITDYPSGIPALALPAEQKGRLERWELYAGGIELANCYSEERDYDRIRRFFDAEAEEKKHSMIRVDTDYGWPEIFRNGFPRCSGTAVGVDRLIMLLSGASSVEGVILFPFSDIISG